MRSLIRKFIIFLSLYLISGFSAQDVEHLTAKDCWEIGHAFYCQSKFSDMLTWMKFAEEKHRARTSQDRRSLQRHLAFAHFAVSILFLV